MEHIKLEVPADERMLSAAADFFRALATVGAENVEDAAAIAGVMGVPMAPPEPTATEPTPVATENAKGVFTVSGVMGVPMSPPPAPEHVETVLVAPAPPTPVETEPELDAPVDSSGLRWDPRIHARTKAVIADGTYRRKRGVDQATFDAIAAEQGAALPPAPAASQTANAAEAGPTAQVAPIAPAAGLAPAAPVSPPATAPSSVQPTPTPQAPPTAPAPMTFATLMTAVQAGGLMQQLQTACTKHGAPSVPYLATNAALIPAIAAELGLQ